MSDDKLDQLLREHASAPPEPPSHLRRDLIAATEPAPRWRWLQPRFAVASAAVMALALGWWIPHRVAVNGDEASVISADDSDSEIADDTALFEIASVAADDTATK